MAQLRRRQESTASAFRIQFKLDRIYDPSTNIVYVQCNEVDIGEASMLYPDIVEFVHENPALGVNSYTAYVYHVPTSTPGPVSAPFEITRMPVSAGNGINQEGGSNILLEQSSTDIILLESN